MLHRQYNHIITFFKAITYNFNEEIIEDMFGESREF